MLFPLETFQLRFGRLSENNIITINNNTQYIIYKIYKNFLVSYSQNIEEHIKKRRMQKRQKGRQRERKEEGKGGSEEKSGRRVYVHMFHSSSKSSALTYLALGAPV